MQEHAAHSGGVDGAVEHGSQGGGGFVSDDKAGHVISSLILAGRHDTIPVPCLLGLVSPCAVVRQDIEQHGDFFLPVIVSGSGAGLLGRCVPPPVPAYSGVPAPLTRYVAASMPVCWLCSVIVVVLFFVVL